MLYRGGLPSRNMELFLTLTTIGAATLIHWVNNLTKETQAMMRSIEEAEAELEAIEAQPWNQDMYKLWSVVE